MKYFVVADVHGFFDEMKAALDEAGFNPSEDTLISLGDVIDRGEQPIEVLEYLIGLPHKILIRGNHEDLLDDLIFERRYLGYHDVTNGTYKTLQLLARDGGATWNCKLDDWFYAARNSVYMKYRDLLVDYAEIDQYIFVHGWIPCDGNGIEGYKYNPNWRDANRQEWEEARWTLGLSCTIDEVYEDGKIIVCGHHHATAWHEYYEHKNKFEDNSIFTNGKMYALDTCTAYSKKVNVLVIEGEHIV